jgi:hypothetical protein
MLKIIPPTAFIPYTTGDASVVTVNAIDHLTCVKNNGRLVLTASFELPRDAVINDVEVALANPANNDIAVQAYKLSWITPAVRTDILASPWKPVCPDANVRTYKGAPLSTNPATLTVDTDETYFTLQLVAIGAASFNLYGVSIRYTPAITAIAPKAPAAPSVGMWGWITKLWQR